ncbi:hypothetical protein RUND412_009559 [Rhizina undulata]
MEGLSEPPEALFGAIHFLHYAYPPALFFYFLISQTISVCTLEGFRAPARRIRRNLIIWLQIAVIATYVGEASLMLARSLVQKGWWSSEDSVIYVLSSVVVWGIIELALLDSTKPVWYPYYGTWLIALATEICLSAVPEYYHWSSNPFKLAKLGIKATRLLLLIFLPVCFWGFQIRDNREDATDEESTGLLSGITNSNDGTNYGSAEAEEADDDDYENSSEMRETRARMMKKLEESGNWWTYAKSFAIFWPLIWPSKDRWLQLSMAMVGICLVVERGLNVMVPHQLGVVTDTLTAGNGAVPWFQVLLFVLFRWLDSGSGVSALQTYLWIPVDQYSYRSISTAAYNHVMSLSHDFHSNKKTADLYTSVTTGRSINGFIESVCFAVLPMLADLCVAFAYFYFKFDAYMALIVAVVSIVYLWVTAKLGSMRNQMRRDFNTTARKEASIMWETMSSWSTVSYFNRIPHEQNRYHGAVKNFQKAERNWNVGMSALNVAQSLVFTLGLLGASFLAVYQVSMGKQPVGSFVTLLYYWAQLSGPLSFFANFYRKIQNQMLDAERLLELFQTKPSIVDRPMARDLQNIRGEVEFENVSFAYDPRKPAIKDMSFRAPPGSTVAFVGETGGGKTTCLKLLFRFYDVISGAIKIDGQDIRDITLWSLRENMGVVPQDPSLFNDTIMNNIKYANFEATDEEVYQACRAAAVHDKIMSFPDGYQSKVGEGGVRISGGELQRISIARAILKNPKIILLDEATSMIDMETERHIQSAFKQLAMNRTMFVVAHRLSTIMNADIIIVVNNGEILEKGTHDELIEVKGKYYQLWSKQMKNDGPKPASERKDLTLVNDLSPKSREEELKKALEKTGARFHGAEPVKPAESKDKFNASTCTANGLKPNPNEIAHKQPAQKSMQNAFREANSDLNVTTAISDSIQPKKSQQFQHRPQLNAKNAVPMQGILKNGEFFKQLDRKQPQTQQTVTKPQSSLKPDAQEFVPRDFAQQTSAPSRNHISDSQAKGSATIKVSQAILPSSVFLENALANVSGSEERKDATFAEDPKKQENNHGNEASKELGSAEIQGNHSKQPKMNFADLEEKRNSQDKKLQEIEKEKMAITEAKKKILVKDLRDTGEVVEDELHSATEAETNNEVRKKRRRTRRRGNKSKSSDTGGEPSGSDTLPRGSLPPLYDEARALGPMKTISPRAMDEERVPNMDGESSASTIDKKPKRRFRTGVKSNTLSKVESENEEPMHINGNGPSHDETGKTYHAKTKVVSSVEGQNHSASKQEPRLHAIQSSTFPQKHAEFTPPTNHATRKATTRDQSRRRSIGRSSGASTKGSWRRTDKVDQLNLAANQDKSSSDTAQSSEQ